MVGPVTIGSDPLPELKTVVGAPKLPPAGLKTAWTRGWVNGPGPLNEFPRLHPTSALPWASIATPGEPATSDSGVRFCGAPSPLPGVPEAISMSPDRPQTTRALPFGSIATRGALAVAPGGDTYLGLVPKVPVKSPKFSPGLRNRARTRVKPCASTSLHATMPWPEGFIATRWESAA